MAEKKLKKLSKKRASRSAGTAKKRTTRSTSSSNTDNLKETASQVWLAGLGALSKAQEEGAKFFENLVRDGLNLEKKTRKATSARINEVRGNLEDRVEDVQSRASSSWDKLEKVFEDRVARALSGLGVPTREDVRELNARVRELQKSVDELAVARATGKKKPATRKQAARKVAKKSARKKTAKKVARKTTKKSAARKK